MEFILMQALRWISPQSGPIWHLAGHNVLPGASLLTFWRPEKLLRAVDVGSGPRWRPSVSLGPSQQRDVAMGALSLISVLLCVLLNSAVAEYTCEGAGYFPHPSDCSQFFRCTDIFANGQYQQYMFTCAEGTVFDASIRTSQRRGMICSSPVWVLSYLKHLLTA